MFLTDSQWELLKPILEVPQKNGFGRPRAQARPVFEAVLFILHTGMQWKYLPKTFPPKSTVHDYLQLWSEKKAFRKLLSSVIRSLVQTGRIDLGQCFVDATFAPAKGGGAAIGLTRKGKGSKIQLIVDNQGVPLGAAVDSASVGETAMVQQTLDLFAPDTPPQRLIGDKAYDCDALDETLAELGIEMIAPHRKNRRAETKTQDGRAVRRYRHRWIVERTIAWLGNHRRLLVRWEKKRSVFMGFILLGCLMIAMRHLP
jgi:transposase